VAGSSLEPDGRRLPWFLVLDQRALIDQLTDDQVLAAAGPLVDPGSSEIDGEAIDVAVSGVSGDDPRQRAWYSGRLFSIVAGEPERLMAALVSRSPEADSAWRVDGAWAVDLPPGVPAPESLGLATPYDRELPVFPEAALGSLRNLDTWRSCDDVGGEPVASAISGKAPGAYAVLAVDRAPPEGLVSADPRTCDTTWMPTGRGPVDVAVDDRLDPRRAYVANHDDDTVTMFTLFPLDGPITVPLDGRADPDCLPTRPQGVSHRQRLGRAPLHDDGRSSRSGSTSCTRCPRSIAVRGASIDSCRVHDVVVRPGEEGGHALTWQAFGCEQCAGFEIWRYGPGPGGSSGGLVEADSPAFPSDTADPPLEAEADPTNDDETYPESGLPLPPFENLDGPLDVDEFGADGDNGWHPLGFTGVTSYAASGGGGTVYWVLPASRPD
jgi:hypothetical protein